MSYTKLAQSILTSTVWMEDDHTRLVWLTLLALADRNGEVQASVPGLANLARVPVPSCRVAIDAFLSPDPDSRTKDDGGRRLEEIDGGWVLVNHAKYRALASDEDRKLKAAIRQQRARDKRASRLVTPKSLQIPQAEAEAEADTKAQTHAQERVRVTAVQSPTTEIADRAAALLDTYAESYTKHRKGAKHLRLGSNLDWTEACKLCETWDDERLRKLIDIFLTTDDEWVSSTARTFRLFVTRASWCDDRLAQWEAKRRPA